MKMEKEEDELISMSRVLWRILLQFDQPGTRFMHQKLLQGFCLMPNVCTWASESIAKGMGIFVYTFLEQMTTLWQGKWRV